MAFETDKSVLFIEVSSIKEVSLIERGSTVYPPLRMASSGSVQGHEKVLFPCLRLYMPHVA